MPVADWESAHQKTGAYANGKYTVSREPEDVANAARKIREAGYRNMKFDPFGNGNLELEREEFHRSIDLIYAVQDAVGDDCRQHMELSSAANDP